MIRVIYFDPVSNLQQTGGEELISRWLKSSESIIWVDIWDEDPQREALLLTENFHIHPLSILDAQRKRHPPKIQKLKGYTFLILKGLGADIDKTQFETIQLTFFIGERFLVTLHKEASASIDKIWKKSLKKNLLESKDTGSLAILITHTVVERFLPILLALEEHFEEIEDEMLTDPNDKLLQQLVSYKTDLKKLRRIMGYHKQVIDQIKSSTWPGFSSRDEIEIHHLHEKLERLYSLSSFYYEQATDLQDGYISLATHQLNQVVKTLTIITVIFIPLSFLAGLYGMNFSYMPELKFKYAYYMILGLMVIIAIGLIFFFKRKKWL